MLNAMTHLVAALAAYTIEPLKLSAFKLLEKKQPGLLNRDKTPNWGLMSTNLSKPLNVGFGF